MLTAIFPSNRQEQLRIVVDRSWPQCSSPVGQDEVAYEAPVRYGGVLREVLGLEQEYNGPGQSVQHSQHGTHVPLESPGTGVPLAWVAAVRAEVVTSQLDRDEFPVVAVARDLPQPPDQGPGLVSRPPCPVSTAVAGVNYPDCLSSSPHGHIEAPASSPGEYGAVLAPAASHQAGTTDTQQVGQAGVCLPAPVRP